VVFEGGPDILQYGKYVLQSVDHPLAIQVELCQNPITTLDKFDEALLSQLNLGKVHERRDLVRADLENPLNEYLRLLEVPQFKAYLTQMEPAVRFIRVELYRLLEVSDRLFELAGLFVDDAQVADSIVVTGFALEAFLQRREGAVILPLFHTEHGEAVQDHDIFASKIPQSFQASFSSSSLPFCC